MAQRAPVSWLSMKVVAFEGHQPSRPGGLPSSSISRQYSQFFTASCGRQVVGSERTRWEHGATSCANVAGRRED